VIESEKTRKRAALWAKQQIEDAGGNLLGVVLKQAQVSHPGLVVQAHLRRRTVIPEKSSPLKFLGVHGLQHGPNLRSRLLIAMGGELIFPWRSTLRTRALCTEVAPEFRTRG
jgi:hypothetical protein